MLDRWKNLWAGEKAPPQESAGEAPSEGGEGAEAPVLEFLRYDEILTFRSSRDLPLLEAFEEPLATGDGSAETLTISPRTRVRCGPGLFEYTADVEGTEAALGVLRERYGPEVEARGGREERRHEPRNPHRIRVRSRQLPLFQGLTHEVSPSGLRLVVEGEVGAGTALDLELQLDHVRLPEVRARGEVRWALALQGRAWWVGVRLDEVQGEAWTEYLGELEAAMAGGLTRKNFLDS